MFVHICCCAQDVTFSSVPGTLDGAYFGIPVAGWCQIVALIAALDIAVFKQVRICVAASAFCSLVRLEVSFCSYALTLAIEDPAVALRLHCMQDPSLPAGDVVQVRFRRFRRL